MRNLQIYFLKEDALIDYIRHEFGLSPLARTKEYRDYIIAERVRKAKTEAMKRVLKVYYQYRAVENRQWI